jgi:hypothetical protein
MANPDATNYNIQFSPSVQSNSARRWQIGEARRILTQNQQIECHDRFMGYSSLTPHSLGNGESEPAAEAGGRRVAVKNGVTEICGIQVVVESVINCNEIACIYRVRVNR